MKPKTKKLTKPGQVPKEGNYACINGEWVRTDKKRNASDSTMRNVKAANRRFEIIDQRLSALEKWDLNTNWDVSGLMTRVEILEEKLIEKGFFPKAKKRAKK